ncbi:hypothetical protein MSSAC_2202 [Methanosarcina siciliae C2J]|uniref:Uncharacterized protein n=3 Tax=Methanosarcina siciliae TaxID=38027 RepID=A0A0E3PDB6_9EURY|nr:hypothetical protein [Methanosarcina siciliae]AKB28557.1 hypothetical protein MSSIT_1838 [Methanosarcina siciliae T4/M]AKB32468.1 hypothetical protein MSSIH_1778 [Methanosarcina siciliae HI350]AKB36792.1 hypothetical protein MSSAC_2202 [Methanosarcina siciliae C2J]
MHLTGQLVLCKNGVLRGSNCCRAYTPRNNLYATRCCCLYCAHSIWIGDEKSARNPFAALQGDPVFAAEVLREESPG